MPVKRTGADPSAAPKRTRFASPPPTTRSGSNGAQDGEDQFLDADITESSRGAKKREKRAVKDTEGYGSDSSDDEEGVVPSRRPGAKDEDEDDEMDMFADEPDEVTDKGKEKEKEKEKEKKKEFMDLDDIKGQEFSKSAEEEDSDSEDEGKPKGEGLDGDMGELTPFNMKNEMESGRFTADGEEYVENSADPHDKHDTWLGEVDKDAIKKARRAHRERERLEKEREQREEAVSGVGSEEREQGLMRQAIELMERGETVLEALQRLGKDEKKKDAGKKKSWAERQKERKAGETAATPFAKLSTIVSDLSAIGQLDVYSLSRESIQRMLPREAEAPAAPRPPPDTREFQYRFSLAYMRSLPEAQRPVEREVFGPFSALQLNAWKATGFFGPECENVEIRLLNAKEEQPWSAWKDVLGA